MPDSDITLGEINRRLTSFEARVTGQFAAVNQRLDSQQFVHRETYDVEIKGMRERVGDLEDRNKWLVRNLAFAFVVAFLAPVLVAVVVTRT